MVSEWWAAIWYETKCPAQTVDKHWRLCNEESRIEGKAKYWPSPDQVEEEKQWSTEPKLIKAMSYCTEAACIDKRLHYTD